MGSTQRLWPISGVLAPLTGPPDPGPQPGHRVVVIAVDGTQRLIDRGELLHRGDWIADVRSDRDREVRRWALMRAVLRAEP